MSKIRNLFKSDYSKIKPSDELINKTSEAMMRSYRCKHLKINWGTIISGTAVILVFISICATTVSTVYQRSKSISPSISGSETTQNTEVKVETVIKNENMIVTINQYTSDGNMLYINFTVETKDGSPLNERSELRKSRIYTRPYSSFYAECDGKHYDFAYLYRTGDINTSNKSTFEGKIDMDIPNGSKVKFVFTDFIDSVATHESIGFTYGNLKDMYNQMIPVDKNEFIDTGAYITYADGSTARSYLIPEGTQHIAFSEKYPGAYIDNIGLCTYGELDNDSLYISIIPGTEENANALKNLGFKNIKTGEVYENAYFPNRDRNIIDPEGRIVLVLQDFDYNTVTPEYLADYIIVTNIGAEEIIRAEGQWEYEFAVNYTDQTKKISVNQPVEALNDTAVIKEITITPLKIYVKGNMTKQAPDHSFPTIIFNMKDGSKIYDGTKMMGQLGPDGPDPESTEAYVDKDGYHFPEAYGIYLECDLMKVLDVENVESIELWDTKINLE